VRGSYAQISYCFLIQQLGASTNFQFDFNVTSVPEPTAIGLLVFGPLLMHRQRRILAFNH